MIVAMAVMLEENFDSPAMDARLRWRNPPRKWWIDTAASRLIIEPDARTDFWRKTGYGFEADTGHLLFARVAGDLLLTTRVRFHAAHQYDQAGLMIRCSPRCWLKTSVEYEPEGPSKLGVVVTNAGYSDWSMQDWPRGRRELCLRVRFRAGDCSIECSVTGGATWKSLRLAHLHGWREGRSMDCGLYACSPKASGYRAEFDFLRVERLDIGL